MIPRTTFPFSATRAHGSNNQTASVNDCIAVLGAAKRFNDAQLIGIKLCPPLRELAVYTRADRIILALMLVTVAFTFAIDRAMLVGFLGYLIALLFRREKPDPFLVVSTFLLLLGSLLQMLH
jgi:hypothetical protein